MCVANLSVSTQPCQHRWYQLVRSCNPGNNLSNCPERLQLEGWEARVETCPFCNGGDYAESTHRVFGSISSASSIASSPTISEMGMTPSATRRGSFGALDVASTLGPLSREPSIASIELDRSQRARDMNQRILMYLANEHHDTLPSARKNAPTYAAAIARVESNSSNKDAPRLLRTDSASTITRGWKRMSGKLATGFYKLA